MPDDDPRLNALESSLNDLATAFKDFAAANTAAEKKEAREDIEDAEDEIERLAKQAGVHPDAIRKARQDAEYARLKPHIERYLDELPPETDSSAPTEDEGAGEREPKADKKPKPDKRTESEQVPDPPAEPPTPDEGPTHPHWSERGIGELIR